MIFPNFLEVTETGLDISGLDVRQLPQFYRASPDWVYRMGGPVYRRILKEAPLTNKEYQYVTVDSRVHMLMPGFLPCIGGWHCDDFYRPTMGQPDLIGLRSNEKYQSLHHAIILGDDVAPTLFAYGALEIPDSFLKTETVYKDCHREIERQQPRTVEARSGEFLTFDCFTFHRGQMARGHGWRLFVRITESNHYTPKNEIRTQTQVYLQDESAGW